MGFLSVGAFALLAIVPVIVALYLLKLKRRDIVISSTYLWKQSVNDMKVNTLFQKLKQNLLMYLQILFVIVATVALARPLFFNVGLNGIQRIVLLDNSASMGAIDIEPSRFEAAREKVREMIGEMSGGDSMMIVSFSSRSRVVASLTSDKSLLLDALSRVEIDETSTSLKEAIAVAASVAASQPNPEIVIVSDGKVGEKPPATEGREIKIGYVKVGRSGENISIDALIARRTIASGASVNLLATISNHGDEARDVVATLTFVGKLIDAKPISLKGRESKSMIFDLPWSSKGTAKVEVNAKDILTTDNTAFCEIAPPRQIRLLLVTEGNFFLENVLRVHPLLQVFKVAPGDFAPKDADGVDINLKYDIMAFDNFSPPGYKEGRAIFFNSNPDIDLFRPRGEAEFPAVVDWKREDSLLRFIDFSNIAIGKMRVLAPAKEIRTVVDTNHGPLIATYDRNGLRALYVGFNVIDSDWPLLKSSFPMFIANAVEWLCASSDGRTSEATTTGVPLVFPAPAGSAGVEVVNPRGERREIKPSGRSFYYPETFLTGLYTVRRRDGVEERYAVNLLDKEESAVAPAEGIDFAGGSPVKGGEGIMTKREVWKYFALAALLLLFAEWLLYHRR